MFLFAKEGFDLCKDLLAYHNIKGTEVFDQEKSHCSFYSSPSNRFHSIFQTVIPVDLLKICLLWCVLGSPSHLPLTRSPFHLFCSKQALPNHIFNHFPSGFTRGNEIVCVCAQDEQAKLS